MRTAFLLIVASLLTTLSAFGQNVSIIYSQGVEGGENSSIYDELLKRTIDLEKQSGNKYIIVSPDSPDGLFPNKEGLSKAFAKAKASNADIQNLNLYFIGHGSIFSEDLHTDIEDPKVKARMSLVSTPTAFQKSTNIDEEVTSSNMFTISGTKKNKSEDYEADTFEEFVKYSTSTSDLREMIENFKETHPNAMTNALMQNCHSGAFGLTLGQMENVNFFNAAQAQDMAITFLTGIEEDDNSFEDYFSLMIKNRTKGLSLNESHNIAIDELLKLYSQNQNMVLKSPGKLLTLPRSSLEQYANSWCYDKNQNLDCIDCITADINSQKDVSDMAKATLMLNLGKNHTKAVSFLTKIKDSAPCDKNSSDYPKIQKESQIILASKKSAIKKISDLAKQVLDSSQEYQIDDVSKNALKLYNEALNSNCFNKDGDFDSNCIGYLYGIENMLLTAKAINQPGEKEYDQFNECMTPYYLVIMGLQT